MFRYFPRRSGCSLQECALFDVPHVREEAVVTVTPSMREGSRSNKAWPFLYLWSSGFDHPELSWVLRRVPPTGCPCDFLSSLKS